MDLLLHPTEFWPALQLKMFRKRRSMPTTATPAYIYGARSFRFRFARVFSCARAPRALCVRWIAVRAVGASTRASLACVGVFWRVRGAFLHPRLSILSFLLTLPTLASLRTQRTTCSTRRAEALPW